MTKEVIKNVVVEALVESGVVEASAMEELTPAGFRPRSSSVEQLVYPHDQSRETQDSVNLIEHENPGAVNQLELETMKLEYQLKTRQMELEVEKEKLQVEREVERENERETTQNETNGVGG
ncbi:hypothetical protein Pmani_025035 [Petrolisthes manimaculis]|uniref:Uncharacterized protein n=1 Tax=Petrolisthes manimaculis TaxID=1843537 RepID=A0AAE1P7I1_9EUCA|nr:hypothetical protein Pmani_025035 [Petrolisthes manimaculis]